MKHQKRKIIPCALGFAILFLLMGILFSKEKKSYANPDWENVGMEILLVDTNYSEKEKEQLQKQYNEKMADSVLDLVDWTGREGEREQYRKELLQR